jgi:hypothetical protein
LNAARRPREGAPAGTQTGEERRAKIERAGSRLTTARNDFLAVVFEPEDA